MEINWSIFGWITAIIVLYLVGVYEGRNTGYKKRIREEEQEKKEQPAPAPVAIHVDDPGVLRIKIENGSPTLDLDGARVNTALLSSDHRRRVIELVSLISPVVDGTTPSASAMTTLPPRFDDAQRRLSQPKPAPDQPAVSTPQPIPSLSPVMPKADRPNVPANSIVAQIDSVLQSRINGTPLAERGVFLAQSPEGGVMVFVGLNKFMGIDDVPDAEIKAAIRAAIKEWENKYTPGL